MKHVCRIFTVVITLLLLSKLSLAQENGASFTGNVWFLTADEAYQDFEPRSDGLELINSMNRFLEHAMSPDGRFVLGRTRISSFSVQEPVISSSLYIWDLADASHQIPLPVTIFPLDSQQAQGGFAIAPDSTRLALFAGAEIQIWRLPEMSLLQTQRLDVSENYSSPTIRWSPSHNAVAVLTVGADELIVWDLDTNNLFSYNTGIEITPSLTGMIDLYATPTGLIYSPPTTICDYSLSSCEVQYIREDMVLPSLRMSANQEVAVSALGTYNEPENLEIFFLTQTDEAYETRAIDKTVAASFCPLSLSYSGRYAYSACANTTFALWDLNSWQVVRELEGGITAFWLAVDSFYITMDRDFILRLYDVSQAEAVDSFDISAIEGIDETELAMSDLFPSYNMSSDGRLILLNIGGYLGVFELDLPNE